MAPLPSFIAAPLRLGANAASASSSLLARWAESLRALTGEASHDVPVAHRGGPQFVATASSPATPGSGSTSQRGAAGRVGAAPTRDGEEEHTTGRRAAELKEPTPQPARGASAASAGTRRASKPKAARAQRKRQASASSLDTVATTGGSGRGGSPSAPAENTPKQRSKAGQGREAAPMGSTDDDSGSG